tara:strand:+ start:327 stop:572 length:246 start_codon:yes stop_codon:yes gene_type:complete
MKLRIFSFLIILSFLNIAHANESKQRVKFYNFDEMLIDGQVKKPKGLLLESRKNAKFNRLLDLKKSFLKNLEDTAKEKTFK